MLLAFSSLYFCGRILENSHSPHMDNRSDKKAQKFEKINIDLAYNESWREKVCQVMYICA